MPYLPITKEEMLEYGWEQPDFIFITGDAYIDHPSFGIAIITRVLENQGFKCAIISQPNLDSNDDFTLFGTPRLAFLINSGNIDSMVNHYTVAKKRRSKDYYTPNGVMGKRPDRAVIKYSTKVRGLYPNIPIIIGGIESSLRRLAHYDYWDNNVRRSILLDSKADLLVYGMGEITIIEIAQALDSGMDIKDLIYLRNTTWKTKKEDLLPNERILLPSYDDIISDKKQYLKSFQSQYENTNPYKSVALVEPYQKIYVVQNPPEFPLNTIQMDEIYALPYMRGAHPLLAKKGPIAALDEVKFSLIINRGCFGGCNFCALTFHQGKIIQSRSKNSILSEAKLLTSFPDFKGYINDVGGPTANFYQKACDKQQEHGDCVNKTCLGSKPCKNLTVDHQKYLQILRELRDLPKIKKVFIRSGIRYDYLMYDKNKQFFEELVEHHISGQLKVAPEHICDEVLSKMGKPSKKLYDEFVKTFYDLNKKFNKEQYLVPYLMSSHPGSTLDSAIELALYLKEIKYIPQQVQDFYPTPGTASTCMYYTEIDPFTNQAVYVPKGAHEKALQRALIQFNNPKNYKLVKEALLLAKRGDLIGNGPKCLIK